MSSIGEFAQLTGQRWKNRLTWILFFAQALALIAFTSLWRGNPAHLPLGPTMAIYFGLAIAWFVSFAAAVRCPSCGRSPNWYLISQKPGSAGEDRLPRGRGCPWCGFVPERPPMNERKVLSATAARVRLWGGLLLFLVAFDGVSYFLLGDVFPSGVVGTILVLLLGPFILAIVMAAFELLGNKTHAVIGDVSPKRFSWLRIAILLAVVGLIILGPAVWTILRDR
jgi:hypothetical protein